MGLEATIKELKDMKHFPHSLLLLGDEGSGRKTLTRYISKNILNIPLQDISLLLTRDLIDEIISTVTPQILLVDIEKIKTNDQNLMLKLLEEPQDNVYMIIIGNNETQFLPTILSRLFRVNMPVYDKDVLQKICVREGVEISEEDLTFLIKTPGDVIRLKNDNINLIKIKTYVSNLLNNLSNIQYPDLLRKTGDFNYKDEFDKMDVKMFLKTLYMISTEQFIKTKDLYYYDISTRTKDYIERLYLDERLNKQILLSSLFTKLWKDVNASAA